MRKINKYSRLIISLSLLFGMLTFIKMPENNKNVYSKELNLENVYTENVIETARDTSEVCKNYVLKLNSSGKTVNTKFHSGMYYEFEIAGGAALCAESGKHAVGGTLYQNKGIISNEIILKAIAYRQNATSDEQKLAAQVVAWTESIDAENIRVALKSAKLDTSKAETLANEINDTDVNGLEFCEYYYSSTYQKIYGKCPPNIIPPSCDPPEDNKCPKYEVSVSGSLPQCQDDQPSKTNISETVAEVYDERVLKSNKKYSKYGKKEEINLNDVCSLYCLEEVEMMLPSGYTEAFEVGSINLVWPQSQKNHASEIYSNFRLVVKMKKKCHVVFNVENTACSYEDYDYSSKYGTFRDYVLEHNTDTATLITSASTGQDTPTTKTTDNYEKIRKWFDSGNTTSGTADNINSYLSAKGYMTAQEAENELNSKKTPSVDACEDGTHTELKTVKGDNCTGTTSPYTCTVANTNDYCDAQGHYTSYAPYSNWSTAVSNHKTYISNIKKYIKQYWNAKKFLVQLYKCDHYNADDDKDSILNNLKKEARITVNKDSGYEEEYIITNKELSSSNFDLSCEECTSSGSDLKPASEIKDTDNSLTGLPDVDKIKKQIGKMEENKEFKISTSEIEYSLPEAFKFKYLDLSNNKLTNTQPTNYRKINYKLVPISMNADPSKDYNLVLHGMKFGSTGGVLYNYFDTNNFEYVCKYNVTTSGDPDPSKCPCPPNSKYNTKNLYYHPTPAIADLSKTNCADAQAKVEASQDSYCYGGGTGELVCPTKNTTPEQNSNYALCIANGSSSAYCENKYCYGSTMYACDEAGTKQVEMTTCVDNDYIGNYLKCFNQYCVCQNCYCPSTFNGEIIASEYVGKVITGCIEKYKPTLGESGAYKYCVRKKCFKYECPANTPNAYMDISGCVELYLKNTYGLGKDTFLTATTAQINKAKAACVSAVCPYSGIKIIYRTIKLENPFPSYDADKSTSKMPELGTFNIDLRGRYPGSNWDSKLLVYNQIINNRGTQYETEVQLNSALNSNIQVTGTTIYQTEPPLYTFRLTPATINNIRAYNRVQNQNGSGGYADFTLNCKKLNGSKNVACRSSFIRDLRYGIQTSTSTCYTASSNANIASFNSCAESRR